MGAAEAGDQVLTDVPLPIPVNETVSAAEVAPSPFDRMLAEGGIALSNAAHAAAVYKGRLWDTHNAARLAMNKAARAGASAGVGRSVSSPYIDSNRGQTHSSGREELRRITYRLAGAGSKQAEAWFDPARVPDPAAFLAEQLGTLAFCEEVREPGEGSIETGREACSAPRCGELAPIEGRSVVDQVCSLAEDDDAPPW